MLIPISDAAAELGVEIGIIGGSGFYEYLDDPVEITVTTPYGEAGGADRGRHDRWIGGWRSCPATAGVTTYAAHRVPFRANVWAMASLGVRSMIGPCAVGSLQPDDPSR